MDIQFSIITNYIKLRNELGLSQQKMADVLNVALFGMTAKERREDNPELAKNGNMRDYTDLLHLIIFFPSKSLLS